MVFRARTNRQWAVPDPQLLRGPDICKEQVISTALKGPGPPKQSSQPYLEDGNIITACFPATCLPEGDLFRAASLLSLVVGQAGSSQGSYMSLSISPSAATSFLTDPAGCHHCHFESRKKYQTKHCVQRGKLQQTSITLHVCMHICMYVCVHIYIYIHIYIYAFLRLYQHVYLHVHLYTCRLHPHLYSYLHVYLYLHLYQYLDLHLYCAHIDSCIYTCRRGQTLEPKTTQHLVRRVLSAPQTQPTRYDLAALMHPLGLQIAQPPSQEKIVRPKRGTTHVLRAAGI